MHFFSTGRFHWLKNIFNNSYGSSTSYAVTFHFCLVSVKKIDLDIQPCRRDMYIYGAGAQREYASKVHILQPKETPISFSSFQAHRGCARASFPHLCALLREPQSSRLKTEGPDDEALNRWPRAHWHVASCRASCRASCIHRVPSHNDSTFALL